MAHAQMHCHPETKPKVRPKKMRHLLNVCDCIHSFANIFNCKSLATSKPNSENTTTKAKVGGENNATVVRHS